MKILFLILLLIPVLVYAFFQWIDGIFKKSVEKDERSEILREIAKGGKERELIQHFLLAGKELQEYVGWTNAIKLRAMMAVLEKYEKIYKVLSAGVVRTTLQTIKTDPTYTVDCISGYLDAFGDDFGELQNLKTVVGDSVVEYSKYLETCKGDELNDVLEKTQLEMRRVESEGDVFYEYRILKEEDE